MGFLFAASKKLSQNGPGDVAMGQLTVGAAGFPPSIRPGRALRRGCGMVGYEYGGLGPRFRGDDGLGARTSFEIVSKAPIRCVGSAAK